MADGGVLLSPYKALGLVCGSVPLVLKRMPKQRLTVVFCAVGGVVHQYNAQSLRLISVSDPFPSPILTLAVDNNYVYVGYGNKVAALHIGRQVKYRYEKDGHNAPVRCVLPFGDHVVSVDEKSRLIVWDIETQEQYTDINLSQESFDVSSIVHPHTYLNKILLGSKQGSLRLMNLKTGKTIHHFAGWDSGVRCLEQSPAVDVVGIGLENGRIHLHNIKYDEIVVSFCQDWGQVTNLAFRTDGPPVMLSSGPTGHVAVWDLEERQVIGQMTDLHGSAVTGLDTVYGEAVFLTSSPDNALKAWIFDLPDGLARLLASREGHKEPATLVRFHSPDGEMLISSGEEGTVRSFSTWKDTKQQNLGTAGTMSRQKAKRAGKDPDSVRLPPVVSLTTDTARESEWDNIVCCHRKTPLVTTWTSRKQRLGNHNLLHPRFESEKEWRDAVANCAVVSVCGNFVIIAYSTGHLDMYNVQSGIFRGNYVDKNPGNDVKPKGRAHIQEITGVCVDGLNQITLSGCHGGKIKFWKFKNKNLIGTLSIKAPVVQMTLHRENSLLAVTLKNYSLVVVDTQCRRIVRRFEEAHSDQIVDVGFSFDGQWLISASEDGCLKVWDLPTATLVDVVKFKHPCVSLSASPTGEYLATCHKNQQGIYLWVNKRVYNPQLVLKPVPADFQPAEWDLPNSGFSISTEENLEGVEILDAEMSEEEDTNYVDPKQLGTSLVTMSGLAAPKWAQLLNMDTIRERNKPKEPPKKPKNAPFFLPTIATTQGFSFDVPNENAEETEKSQSQNDLAQKLINLNPRTEFTKILFNAKTPEDLSKAFVLLKSYGPAKIEMEILELTTDLEAATYLLRNFLRMIELQLKSNLDFELAQSYLSVFVKLNRESLWNGEVVEKADLEKVANIVQESWGRMDTAMSDSLCIVQWLKTAVL